LGVAPGKHGYYFVFFFVHKTFLYILRASSKETNFVQNQLTVYHIKEANSICHHHFNYTNTYLLDAVFIQIVY